jgi:hypothetical protein
MKGRDPNQILIDDGVDAVRDGILGARPYAPNSPPSGDSENEKSASEIAEEAEISRLARLSPLAYDREREAAAEKLGCRVATLDDQVKAARGQSVIAQGQGRPIDLPEIEPGREGVDGTALLTALSNKILEYVVLSVVQADAVTLWSVHTHANDASDISPKLVLKSPQKRSGKSRLVEVLQRIVARPLLTSGIKPAALLRIIEMYAPTLLLDEMDAVMKQDREMAEALRGIINSGFNRTGARFIMNVPTPGGGYEPREFSTFAPQLLSGIGDLPDTVRDRSIEIEMQRKRSNEIVKRLRRHDGDDLNVLGQKSARWAKDNLAGLSKAMPGIPTGLNDRAADAWEPLLAIADHAGGEWPRRARKAALALSGNHIIEDEDIGTLVLADIRQIFAGTKQAQITSELLVDALVAIEGHPWAEFGHAHKPITKNRLARLLKPYGIRPAGTIRIGSGEDDTRKGYKLEAFADAFERYLPEPPNLTVTPSQTNESAGFRANSTVTPSPDGTDETAEDMRFSNGCDGVTDAEPLPTDDVEVQGEEEEWTV